MVNDDATEAQVTAADNAIAALQKAIAGAVDLPEGDTEVASAQGTLTALMDLLATAKTSRMTAMAEADKTANAAMILTAAKLYGGISTPAGSVTTLSPNDRAAAYNDAGTPTAAAADTRILVSNSGDTALSAAIVLSEDKKTMVAANHGWEGKRYADPAGGDMVEAIVYSNVGEPTMGRKFGSAAAATAADREFEYQLAEGVLSLTAGTDDGGRVAITDFPRTAGTETFHLPDPNPGEQQNIIIPGSYHGVSGNYRCNPATDASGCSVTVAAEGFTLSSGDTWAFVPSDPNARIMESADTIYASYGWWLHKTANGQTFTASAFHDEKGGVPAAAGLDTLNGTARYTGGAAGKYALSSSTGGTNDAGHFTARAVLDANFTDNEITGTIDMFTGADGRIGKHRTHAPLHPRRRSGPDGPVPCLRRRHVRCARAFDDDRQMT